VNSLVGYGSLRKRCEARNCHGLVVGEPVMVWIYRLWNAIRVDFVNGEIDFRDLEVIVSWLQCMRRCGLGGGSRRIYDQIYTCSRDLNENPLQSKASCKIRT
jgi:hypothetical protein